MIFKIHQSPLILIAFTLLFYFSDHSAGAQTNSTLETFSDPETGISFQYPSDWNVVSKEYVDTIFGASDLPVGTVKPIVALLPESMNGDSFSILAETLPFPMSVEKYYESSKRGISMTDPSAEISNPVDISIAGLNGLKFNTTYSDSEYQVFLQTQIVFIKDSTAFVITSDIAQNEQSKHGSSINSIIDSLDFNVTTNSSGSHLGVNNNPSNMSSSNESNTDAAIDLVNELFNYMSPPTSGSFVDNVTGFKITFPQGWNGTSTDMFFMKGATVSPSGFNISNIMTQNIGQMLKQNSTEGYAEMTGEQMQPVYQQMANETVSDLISSYPVTLSVTTLDREFLDIFTSDPMQSKPTSLSELVYETNGIAECTISLVNYTKLNNIPTEYSTSECNFDPSIDKTKSLNYVMATNDKIISVDYSATLDQFDKYHEEAIESFKTIELVNPIDPLTILK